MSFPLSLHCHSGDVLAPLSGMDEGRHLSLMPDLGCSSSSSIETEACVSSKASLQSALIEKLHCGDMNETKNVCFSRVVQVREITHRNDMSQSELGDRWGVDEEIDSSIFDSVDSTDADITSLERKLHRLRRREAWVIRRKFLCEWEACRRKGMSQLVDNNYSQDSRLKAIDAHQVALMLSRELEPRAFDLSVTGVPSKGQDGACRQPTFSKMEDFSPCRPAKRQRSSV